MVITFHEDFLKIQSTHAIITHSIFFFNLLFTDVLWLLLQAVYVLNNQILPFGPKIHS